MDERPLKDDDARASRPALVRPWIWALLAAVLTLSIYLPALAGEFVWDDTQLIAQTTPAGRHRSFVELFTKPFWEPNSISPQMNLYYRPLVALSYELDHSVHGLNSAGYRITNYAFHVANVVLLFILARRFGASGLTAGLLSATWGVLPRLSESVAWISGRTDVLACCFMLAALVLWAKRWPRRLLASICLVLGLFCKETALAGLVVLTLFELSDTGVRARLLAARLSALATPALLGLYLKLRVSGILPSGVEHQTWRTRVLTTLEAIGRYPTLIVDWLRPRAEIGIMGKPSLPFVVLGVVVLAAGLTTLALLWRKLSWIQRGLIAGAIAALVPVLHIVQLTIAVNAADRFLYIPLALSTLALCTSPKLCRSKIVQVSVAVVLVSSVPVTVSRAQSWTDPVDLWATEYRTSGGTCETCRIELGKLQAEAGDFIPALRMHNSLMSDTAHATGVPGLVLLNTAILYLRIGDYDRALTLLTRLVRDAPAIPRFWRELATAQAARGEFTLAEKSAQRALELMPSYDNAQVALGLIRTLPARAAQLAEPGMSNAQRADTLSAMGRTLEAEKLWLRVLEQPSHPGEVERALGFMLNLGSSRAVTHVLQSYPELLRNSPELAGRLRLKDDLHRKLARLQLTTTDKKRNN